MASEYTTADRLEELEAKSARRKYEEARDAAGFDVDSDYNAWRELETLRNLTLTERRAAEEKANPKPKPTGITLNGSLSGYTFSGPFVTGGTTRNI